MEVAGVIQPGESAVALASIQARRGLSPRWARVILLLPVMAVAIPINAWITGSLSKGAGVVECVIISAFAGGLVVRGLSTPMMRKALAQRGQAFDQALTVRLTPTVLVYDLDHLVMTADWACVTDLYRTKRYWVFLVQSSAMVLPRRLFATAEDEGRFIAQAVSLMTPAARGRSPEAVSVAGP
jgi:hypothetical protein